MSGPRRRSKACNTTRAESLRCQDSGGSETYHVRARGGTVFERRLKVTDTTSASLKRTALHGLHLAAGGKMVPFAGYDMPVQFSGVKDEHLWTRSHAGLFDVSHMGPCWLSLKDTSLSGDIAHQAIARVIERVVPSDIAALKPGQARLTVLLNPDGGILDDLIITRPANEADQGGLYIVVNGAVKAQDFTLLERCAGREADLTPLDDSHVLMALQGPQAVEVIGDHFRQAPGLTFMRSHITRSGGGVTAISRCGYTGEDGFEILLPASDGLALAEALLDDDRVRPIGLGARDSLRLEAGLCLYGNDMDPSRDPVEADLAWLIQKSRRARADFPGAARILKGLTEGTEQVRVGIQPLERAPARAGTDIYRGGEKVGHITSGGFGPSVGRPIAMGYVSREHATPGTPIALMIRGKARPAEVCALPFLQPNYNR